MSGTIDLLRKIRLKSVGENRAGMRFNQLLKYEVPFTKKVLTISL